jgi:hypothetical protein
MTHRALADEIYEVERAPLGLAERTTSWLGVLVSGRLGGVSAPRRYEYRVYVRAHRRLVLVLSDDALGTDYEAMLRTNLESMTPDEFRAEWKIEPASR